MYTIKVWQPLADGAYAPHGASHWHSPPVAVPFVQFCYSTLMASLLSKGLPGSDDPRSLRPCLTLNVCGSPGSVLPSQQEEDSNLEPAE